MRPVAPGSPSPLQAAARSSRRPAPHERRAAAATPRAHRLAAAQGTALLSPERSPRPMRRCAPQGLRARAAAPRDRSGGRRAWPSTRPTRCASPHGAAAPRAPARSRPPPRPPPARLGPYC
eukprot:1558622-Prymnesium_polylepis.1